MSSKAPAPSGAVRVGGATFEELAVARQEARLEMVRECIQDLSMVGRHGAAEYLEAHVVPSCERACTFARQLLEQKRRAG